MQKQNSITKPNRRFPINAIKVNANHAKIFKIKIPEVIKFIRLMGLIN